MDLYHIKKFKKCKYCTNEAKRNISNGRNKGHYITCGSIECVKRNFTDPFVIQKKKHIGEKHPKWIKDRTKVKAKRTIAEMKWWRKAVFERDNYTCQHCGKKGYVLNADHIKPYILFPELREDINNGRTLCIDCHKKTPTYARNAKHYVTISK